MIKAKWQGLGLLKKQLIKNHRNRGTVSDFRMFRIVIGHITMKDQGDRSIILPRSTVAAEGN